MKRMYFFLGLSAVFFICLQIFSIKIFAAVPNAVFCDPAKTKIDTAIGCIPIGTLPLLLAFLLKWVMGLTGGILLLMLIINGYGLLAAQGNPEKLQGAKENLTAVLAGFILIVFSLVLLRAIGLDILGLPSF